MAGMLIKLCIFVGDKTFIGYYIFLVSRILNFTGQAIVMSMIGKICYTWFPQKERELALTLSIIVYLLGCVIVYLFP